MASTSPPNPGINNLNYQHMEQYPPDGQRPYPPQVQTAYPPLVQSAYLPPVQQPYPPPVQQPYPSGAPPPYSDKFLITSPYPGYINDTPSDIVDVESSIDDTCGIVTGFDNDSIRRGFIRKVFAILGCQMLVTIGMTVLFMFNEGTNYYVKHSIGLYIAAYCVFFVLYFVLSCCASCARNHPMNLILLGLFTLSLGYMVAVISAFHDTYIVLSAFGMTVFCTVGVVIFATQTKFDVTACSGALFCFGMFVLLFGIFAGVLVPHGYMSIANVAYSALGALLFMAYLAYDIQLLMGGKKFELSPEEYVFAAVQLYVDVIYIFLFILRLFGGSK